MFASRLVEARLGALSLRALRPRALAFGPALMYSHRRHMATVPPQAAEITSEIQAIAEPAVSATTQTVLETIAAVPPDQVGYFESLGLAQSWVWPSDIFQHVFEIAHVYSGLPWWATILGVTIVTRTLMLPLYTSSSDATARMARIKPELTELMETTKTATDQKEIHAAMLARKRLMDENKIKITNMVKPLFAIPIFLGVFNALNGMCKVQVHGLADGGLLWFPNFIMPDPYCGLQILTALFYSLTFKFFGGETGAGNISPVMKKVFTYMPFVAVPLTMALPSCICFYFAINGIISVVQSNLLKQPKVREYFKLAPMVTPEEQKVINERLGKKEDDSVFGALKQKFEDAKKQAERKVKMEELTRQQAQELDADEESQYIRVRPKRKH